VQREEQSAMTYVHKSLRTADVFRPCIRTRLYALFHAGLPLLLWRDFLYSSLSCGVLIRGLAASSIILNIHYTGCLACKQIRLALFRSIQQLRSRAQAKLIGHSTYVRKYTIFCHSALSRRDQWNPVNLVDNARHHGRSSGFTVLERL